MKVIDWEYGHEWKYISGMPVPYLVIYCREGNGIEKKIKKLKIATPIEPNKEQVEKLDNLIGKVFDDMEILLKELNEIIFYAKNNEWNDFKNDCVIK